VPSDELDTNLDESKTSLSNLMLLLLEALALAIVVEGAAAAAVEATVV
jgi:hypothetical protein